uniref:(northern house mosquito) hypothetical protein n=1 Tax=Culex pipiens TaxID=7175 RepID=A0A8D8FZQ6_CULPI
MCHTGKERFANILENNQQQKMGRKKQAWHESYTKRFVFYILCVFFVNIVFFCSSYWVYSDTLKLAFTFLLFEPRQGRHPSKKNFYLILCFFSCKTLYVLYVYLIYHLP